MGCLDQGLTVRDGLAGGSRRSGGRCTGAERGVDARLDHPRWRGYICTDHARRYRHGALATVEFRAVRDSPHGGHGISGGATAHFTVFCNQGQQSLGRPDTLTTETLSRGSRSPSRSDSKFCPHRTECIGLPRTQLQ